MRAAASELLIDDFDVLWLQPLAEVGHECVTRSDFPVFTKIEVRLRLRSVVKYNKRPTKWAFRFLRSPLNFRGECTRRSYPGHRFNSPLFGIHLAVFSEILPPSLTSANFSREPH